jgi:hypothetical protein
MFPWALERVAQGAGGRRRRADDPRNFRICGLSAQRVSGVPSYGRLGGVRPDRHQDPVDRDEATDMTYGQRERWLGKLAEKQLVRVRTWTFSR